MARKVNWEKIETEYITGNISQRKLAEKHGVSVNVLEKRAQAGKWTAAREDYRRKTAEKAVRKIGDEQAERIKDQLMTAAMMATTIDDAMKDQEQFKRYIVTEGLGDGYSVTIEKTFDRVDFKALKDAAAALQTVVKIQKDILAMDHIVDQKERDKLEIERSKSFISDDETNETGVVILAPVLDEDDEEEDDAE